MMKSVTKIMLSEQFVKPLAEENMKIIKAQTKQLPKSLKKELLTAFIYHYVNGLLAEALTDYPKVGISEKKAYDIVSRNFTDVKNGIQEEIANAFQEAMRAHTGKVLDYYCQISPVGEAINKEPI